MGVGYQGLQFTLLAKRRNANFERTITLGRQNHYLDPATLTLMYERFGFTLDETDVQEILKDLYAERLFKNLGATRVDSVDASNYEGATIIWDLNHPIGKALVQQYTCVVDFGLLEHVFNFPVALKNATVLLKEGGHFISVTTANNFLGHGFYQFSPELFFNYLSKNGFTDIEVYLVPHRHFPYLFRVTDPQELRGRVELVNGEPVAMGVLARKVKHIPKAVIPIQSDYSNELWKGRDTNRQSALLSADPETAEKMKDLGARLATLLTWPETLSPHLVPGFENSLHFRLMDPARD